MPEKYAEAILKYLSGRGYQPLKPRQLARHMGVDEADYGTFREAIKLLRDAGRVVLGARNAVMLPEMSGRVVGTYRANPRGFGFVIPETPTAHGDLYIPEGDAADAMTGDTVVARVLKRGKRGGEMLYHGRVVEVLRRASRHVVGTLERAEGTWFLQPEGKAWLAPVVIADMAPGMEVGDKVVVEIVAFPEKARLARGVVVERLGQTGQIEVETEAIVRAHGLPDEFEPEALEEARRMADAFDPAAADGRADLSGQVIVTIDPPDARDFDDAISLEPAEDGGWVLGVHIADVSHFVPEGGPLDAAARQRGNSVYFPRKVLPMLPEVLSNAVCSLQEGQGRFCQSVFIRYDREGKVAERRLDRTVIRSAKRLTYPQAQSILDGKTGGYDGRVVELLRRMDRLARLIEARRMADGMIELDLPGAEPVLSKEGKVVDVVPEDDSYTHKIIEMFMVEANEAVAGILDGRSVSFLRRVHPRPDPASAKELAAFVRACGHKLPRKPAPADIQGLLEAVKGRPEGYAVNLAVLKSFKQAEYSPLAIGHFALASGDYCHFTSPIRRYPDLTVHRAVGRLLDAVGSASDEGGGGATKSRPDPTEGPETGDLVKLGEHCSTTERRAEAAEEELISVLMLQFLAEKVGEVFDGVVTGLTNFGVFVRLPRFGVEGLIRMADLGDDWWEVHPRAGEIRGERSGRRFRLGRGLKVKVASVNLPARQLNLIPEGDPEQAPRKARRKDGPARPGRKRRK